MIDLETRARWYNEKFPGYPKLVADKGWLYGAWRVGNNYKRKSGFYGEYPPCYLKRIHSIFQDCKKVLHLFSGTVQKGYWEEEVTFDINPDLKPDVVGDAREILKFFKENEFDLILADPPYEKEDFKIYGCEPFNKNKVVNDVFHIVKPNGFLVWMDLREPMYNGSKWKIVGSISYCQGCNHRIRNIWIFQKREKENMGLDTRKRLKISE